MTQAIASDIKTNISKCGMDVGSEAASVVLDLCLHGDGGLWCKHVITPMFLVLAHEVRRDQPDNINLATNFKFIHVIYVVCVFPTDGCLVRGGALRPTWL